MRFFLDTGLGSVPSGDFSCPREHVLNPLPGGLTDHPEFQIVWRVVGPVSVLVVNPLSLYESAAEDALHHDSMFELPISRPQPYENVAVVVEGVGATNSKPVRLRSSYPFLGFEDFKFPSPYCSTVVRVAETSALNLPSASSLEASHEGVS